MRCVRGIEWRNILQMSTTDEEETVEEYTRRLAKNRYDMRMCFKWRLSDTSTDDWNYAKEVVQRELHQDTITPRHEENISGDQSVGKGLGQSGI